MLPQHYLVKLELRSLLSGAAERKWLLIGIKSTLIGINQSDSHQKAWAEQEIGVRFWLCRTQIETQTNKEKRQAISIGYTIFVRLLHAHLCAANCNSYDSVCSKPFANQMTKCSCHSSQHYKQLQATNNSKTKAWQIWRISAGVGWWASARQVVSGICNASFCHTGILGGPIMLLMLLYVIKIMLIVVILFAFFFLFCWSLCFAALFVPTLPESDYLPVSDLLANWRTE